MSDDELDKLISAWQAVGLTPTNQKRLINALIDRVTDKPDCLLVAGAAKEIRAVADRLDMASGARG